VGIRKKHLGQGSGDHHVNHDICLICSCVQPKAARSDKGDVMAEMAKLLVSSIHSTVCEGMQGRVNFVPEPCPTFCGLQYGKQRGLSE